MNLLGKLFIVLIFIGSIMLASFSVVLYATHRNWKQHADVVTAELNKKKDDLTKLQAIKAEMEAALKLEIKRQADRSVALARKVDELTQDYSDARDKNADLEALLAKEVETTRAASKDMEMLRIRLDGVSEALVKAQKEWVEMSTELVKEMDKSHSLAIQVTNYQTTGTQLAKDYRDAMEVLRIFGK